MEKGAISKSREVDVHANPKVHPFKRRFEYFDLQLGHPEWGPLWVLDFGGNAGNVLRDPLSTIDPRRYHCVDVVQDAVDLGKKDFPLAHWHHYNRFNFAYNRFGKFTEPFPHVEQKFDVILAFSVFTHMTESEMCTTIREDLLPRLAPGGRLAFSLFDPSASDYFFHQRLKRRPDLNLEELRQQAAGRDRFLYIDCDRFEFNTEMTAAELDRVYGTGDDHLLVSFFSKDYMRRLLPLAQVKDEANHEIAYCVVGGAKDFGG